MSTVLKSNGKFITPQVGQKVILRGTNYSDWNSNPIWEGKFGKVVGTITRVASDISVIVDWENKTSNSYFMAGDLQLYSDLATATPTIPATSLSTLVNTVVKTVFVDAQKSFSAYDVTTAVREKVNSGVVLLENVPFTDINGKNTQRVSHDDVRPLVRSYMDSVSSYSRNFAPQGNYTLYTYVGQTPVASALLTAPSVTYAPTGVTTSAPQTVSKSLESKIVSYVQSRPSATLKQIQSRLRRDLQSNPLTVRDIAGITTKVGLKLDTKAPYHASVVTQ